jgi:GH15 family glucan-1,4-alpha-glucosidase
VIYALWTHYEYTKDLEFIESMYNPVIKKASDFMVGFRTSNKLPKPTYDLWEEKFGVHTFTTATVSAALDVAARFARILGKRMDEHLFSQASKEIKYAILEYLFNSENNYYYKSINIEDGELLHDKTIDASTFYGLFKFGILDIDDERLIKAKHVLEQKLRASGDFGNIVRYENDQYFTQHPETPGNPWIITTLWLAQYYVKKAKVESDLQIVKEYINWVVRCALPSGVLSEQIDPYTGNQLSAAPLIWSHAEYVTTIIDYLEKLEELGVSKVTIPPNE